MSLIEINKPLLRLTRESVGGGPCPDTTIRFFGEPPSAVYSYPAGTFITVDLLDESGNYLQIVSYTQVGNNIDIVVDSDTPILVNGTPEGDITNWTPINVNLEDSVGNPVAPVSTALVGNTLTIEVPTGVTPSGVDFQIPHAQQYTSFANFDEGWRWQNNWWDYVAPTNPAKRAYLDYTAGANAFYTLGQALQVGANDTVRRFVDIDGLQNWTAINNKDAVTIDKLTGLMFTRLVIGTVTYANALTGADSYSITVDGTTFNDWYLISLHEAVAIFGSLAIASGGGGIAWEDPVTGADIWRGTLGNNHIATTVEWNTANSYAIYIDAVTKGWYRERPKTETKGQIYVRKCRNLIS